MNKRPIIINIDPGIDNAFTVAIVLFPDELDVRLIPTVAGNAGLDRITYNALRLLKYFEREDVSTAVGVDRPLVHEFEDASSVYGKSGIEGFDFEEPTQQPLKGNAVDTMRNVIMNSSKPVTLIPTASLTSIALLLKTYPEVRRNTHEITLIGDSANRGDKDVMTEFNIALDPETAHMVLHSGIKLTMIEPGVGLKALVLPEDSGEIRIMNKTGEMAYRLFKKHRGGSFRAGLKMYGAAVVAHLLKPGLFEAVKTYLDVKLHGVMTAGCTLVGLKGYSRRKPNTTVCLDIDGSAFRTWFEEAIAKCR